MKISGWKGRKSSQLRIVMVWSVDLKTFSFKLGSALVKKVSMVCCACMYLGVLKIPSIVFEVKLQGSPSSSCKMITLRSKSHGENIRVCMGKFTNANLRKKNSQTLYKSTSPYFHSASLVVWPLTMLKRSHFSDLLVSRFPNPSKPRNG